jgi:hypothetical protein
MAATIKGTTLAISYGSFSFTGYVPEDVTLSFPDGNIEVVRDADGATMTKILQDPTQKLDITVVTTSNITPPIQGAIVSLTPPQGTATSYYVESAEARFTSGATRLSLSLIKETSMTYAT